MLMKFLGTHVYFCCISKSVIFCFTFSPANQQDDNDVDDGNMLEITIPDDFDVEEHHVYSINNEIVMAKKNPATGLLYLDPVPL